MGEGLDKLEIFLLSDSECVLSTVFNNIRTEWINYEDIVSKCSFANKEKINNALNALYLKNLIEKKGSQYMLSIKGLELINNTNR